MASILHRTTVLAFDDSRDVRSRRRRAAMEEA